DDGTRPALCGFGVPIPRPPARKRDPIGSVRYRRLLRRTRLLGTKEFTAKKRRPRRYRAADSECRHIAKHGAELMARVARRFYCTTVGDVAARTHHRTVPSRPSLLCG